MPSPHGVPVLGADGLVRCASCGAALTIVCAGTGEAAPDAPMPKVPDSVARAALDTEPPMTLEEAVGPVAAAYVRRRAASVGPVSADDYVVIANPPKERKPCPRCHGPVRRDPDARQAGRLPSICWQCLTPAEQEKVRTHRRDVIAAQHRAKTKGLGAAA